MTTAITVQLQMIFWSKITFSVFVHIVFKSLSNEDGLKKELGRAELQRMFHNVTERWK
jgi:hypothetical protein